MKSFLLTALLFTSLLSLAHEGGHGAITEGGKFGGITAPVMSKSEAGNGDKAKTLFKAELVRSEDGTLRVYLFDASMKLLPLNDFSEKIEAKLEVKKKGKFTYVGAFEFKKASNHFIGKLPVVEFKPFNIDMFFKNKHQDLFVGFSNLD